MFTLVVFTLVTGDGLERLLHARHRERRDVRRRLRRPREHRRRARPSSTSSGPSPTVPGLQAGRHRGRRVASRSCPIEATQVGTGQAPRALRRARARPRVPGATRPSTSGKIAEGYGDSADVWRAIATRPGLAVVDSTIVPRRDNFNFAVPTRLQVSAASTSTRARSSRSRSRCGPAVRQEPRADRDRNPLRDDADRDGGHLDVAEDARHVLPRPCLPDHLLLRPRPASRRLGGGDEARVRVPRQRHGGGVDRGGHARRHVCVASPSTV